MGCGAIVSAAAECSHPVKQGLIESFSIYVDTLFIGTSTALIVLLTGTFDVIDGAGNFLMSQTGGIETGIKWTQHALMSTFGSWSGKALAIIIVLFAIPTPMTGYCYQAESNIRYSHRQQQESHCDRAGSFSCGIFPGGYWKCGMQYGQWAISAMV